MKKKILIIQHVSRKHPGFIFFELEKNGIAFDSVDFKVGDTLPESGEEYSALIVLGGPESAADRTDVMNDEILFVKKWLESEKPYLGICLGMQILAVAAGGSIRKGVCREVGFRDLEEKTYDVTLTESGEVDLFLEGVPKQTNVFQLHGDTVDLVEKIELLGVGSHCDNQIIRIGENAYGTQFHFELTRELFDIWLKENSELKKLDHDLLERDFDQFSKKHLKTGKQIFRNFLQIAKFI